MVWYQYVWEASTGNEVDASDDDNDGQEPLHVDDWIDYNSDELEYLWAILREYIDDAGSRIFPNMSYEDFARFCHDPPMYRGQFDMEFWIDTHTEELAYMWKLLKRTKSQFIRHVPYESFTYFCFRSR
jgi:hypothetical protein